MNTLSSTSPVVIAKTIGNDLFKENKSQIAFGAVATISSMALFVLAACGIAGCLPGSTLGLTALGLAPIGYGAGIMMYSKNLKERKIEVLIYGLLIATCVTAGTLGALGVMTGQQIGACMLATMIITSCISIAAISRSDEFHKRISGYEEPVYQSFITHFGADIPQNEQLFIRLLIAHKLRGHALTDEDIDAIIDPMIGHDEDANSVKSQLKTGYNVFKVSSFGKNSRYEDIAAAFSGELDSHHQLA